MRIIAAGATDAGLERSNNEDTFLIDEEIGLYVVCDGMGGHAAGEVASRLAAERARTYLRVFIDDLMRFKDSPSARKQITRLVEKAIQEASRTVYDTARSDTGKHGMGTTMSLVLVRGHVAIIGHVGDTRVYLLRGDDFHQLTQDHTYLAEFIRGGLSLEKARQSKIGHRLTQAIGLQPTVKVDTLVVELIDGDRLLMCSDGLVGHIDTPFEIGPMLYNGRSPQAFIDFANKNDGSDNVTALTIHITHEPHIRKEEASRDTQILRKIGALGHVWLFEQLSLREIALVMGRMSEHTFEAGSDIIQEGDDGDSLFILLDGEACVFRGGEEVNRMEGGEHFGEMALVTERTRSATVTAITDCRVFKMEKSNFSALIQEHPRLGNRMLLTIAEVLVQRLDSKERINVVLQRQSSQQNKKVSLDKALAEALEDEI